MKHANVGIFIPHNGCPHQCSFCNQKSITGQADQPSVLDVMQTLHKSVGYLGNSVSNAEIAFFGGSFTAIDKSYMISLLEIAYEFVKKNGFEGIRISTRPDAIDGEILCLLKKYGVTSIELGAQSMDDNVLQINCRGHTANQVVVASKMIKEAGFLLGLQMMTGLDGDTNEISVETAKKIAALVPNTVRIYPTIVMKDTPLAERYAAGKYLPMNLETAVALCAELLEIFDSANITVIRLGLHSTPELEHGRLAGPWHPAFRELCESRAFLLNVEDYLKKNKISQGKLLLVVNPTYVSKAVGQNRANIAELHKLGYEFKLQKDSSLKKKEFRILF